MEHYDIVIIGGGCAGLTAAVYARRAQKSVLLLENNAFGGQITASAAVENFPGFQNIKGTELADRLFAQAAALGTETRFETALSIEESENEKIVVTDGDRYSCGALIIAVGLRHRMTGLSGENRLIGRGVSTCAVCDGALFRGKDTAVLGGGNTAVHDALYLADLCKSVTVIHRRDTFRADAAAVEALSQKPNVRFLFHTVLKEIHGDERLSSLTVTDTETGEDSSLPVAGLFLAIGLLPQNEPFQGVVELDESGYIKAGEDCRTSCRGIFAAGDCRTKPLRQLATAAADGAVAATGACRFLS